LAKGVQPVRDLDEWEWWMFIRVKEPSHCIGPFEDIERHAAKAIFSISAEWTTELH
jgi:hypothetical protein